MCELIEKYMKESELQGEIKGKLQGKIEGKIEATIKTAKSFGASDSNIIKALMENCDLTEDEAKQKLAEYNN